MLLSFIEGRADLGMLVAWIVGAALAITVHEYAHARRALAAGDNTPVANGRVTLNPLAHYDPVGTTLFLFAGFGWAKPVPVNPSNFRDRRSDGLMVALWGPLSNIIMAAAFAIPLRLEVTGAYTQAVFWIVFANCVLAIFNLIPIGPLDGAHVLENLLPPKQSMKLQQFYRQHGRTVMIVAIVLLFVPPFSDVTLHLLMMPIYGLVHLLTGSPV
ncbi:MAG: site-2 protease family protein [Armatimonadota bacterium]